MRKIPALLLVLAVAACTSTPQTPKPAAPGPVGAPLQLTDAERATVEAGVRAMLTGNQAGATFRTMTAAKGADGVTRACGYFNTGGSDTPYIGTLAGTVFTVTDMGGTQERTIAVQQACQSHRIYI